MSIEGVDFAYGRPGGAALVAAGKKFVVRYIGVSDNDGRALTAAEVKDYHGHGLTICLVFESTSSRALSGRAGGIADARTALARMAKLGVPDYVPMYFAVDFNVRPDQYGTVDAYLQGAATVLGGARVGVYGHADYLSHTRAIKVARWFWQTYAWSAGAQMVGRHLYQYNNGERINGAGVDLCRAYPENYGQWAPVPPAPPSDVEDPVGLDYHISDTATGVVTVKGDGHSLIVPSDGRLVPIPNGQKRAVAARVRLVKPLDDQPGDRQHCYLVGNVVPDPNDDTSIAALLLTSDGDFVADPPPDCTDAINAVRSQYDTRIKTLKALAGQHAAKDRADADAYLTEVQAV